jgi:hypothetical protein
VSKATSFKPVVANACLPEISLSVDGHVTVVSLLKPENEDDVMLTNPSGRRTVSRFEHPVNAY